MLGGPLLRVSTPLLRGLCAWPVGLVGRSDVVQRAAAVRGPNPGVAAGSNATSDRHADEAGKASERTADRVPAPGSALLKPEAGW